MINYQELIKKAFEARDLSYSPYSGFQVGAALLGGSNKIFQGCNIENASYTPSNCAERTAFFKAVSEGEKEFSAIAIVGGRKDTAMEDMDFCAPCGVCRQVMVEFCDTKTFEVILAKNDQDYCVYKLEDLLPLSFSGRNIK